MFRIRRMSRTAAFIYIFVVLVSAAKIISTIKWSSKYEWSVLVPTVSSKDLWDFVADLNHFRITDPGVVSMEITSDKWSHPEWRYGVILREIRPETGEWETKADYLVSSSAHGYHIVTTFTSCRTILCLYGTSEVTFSSAGPETGQVEATILKEKLTLEGSLFLWPFLASEALAKVHFTRINNIRGHYVAKDFAPLKKIPI